MFFFLLVNSICDGHQEEILSLNALEAYCRCFNNAYDTRDTIFLFQRKTAHHHWLQNLLKTIGTYVNIYFYIYVYLGISLEHNMHSNFWLRYIYIYIFTIILNDWIFRPVGELDASHMVAEKKDFNFYRVLITSRAEGSRAFEEISRKQYSPPLCGGKFTFQSKNLLFSLLPRIYLGNVRCYVAKKSKVLLRLICNME